MSKPTICLASIVKNERHIIKRMLESALPWIDSYFIIDTGSTDATSEAITSFFDDNGVEGTVIEEGWVDFGYNRSSLLRQAGALGFDYLLLLDADMTVIGEEGVLDHLTADGYYIKQATGGFEWWMPYLVKADKPWKFVGRTHEFLACDDDFELTRIYGFSLEHFGDGGTRPEKSTRDLVFLEKDLADDPTNVRHMFYLAQTYQDVGEKEKAAELYQRRIDAGGWDEEIYISKLRLASLTEDVAGYLAAYNYRPGRAEALYHAIKALNEKGAYRSSYALGIAALDDLKEGDTLFVDHWIEEYGLQFELAIATWWAGHQEQAKKAFQDLLEIESMPQHYRNSVIHNLKFCE